MPLRVGGGRVVFTTMKCEGSGSRPLFKDNGQGKCSGCGSLVGLTKKGNVRSHDIDDTVPAGEDFIATRRVYVDRDGNKVDDGRHAVRLLTKTGRRYTADYVAEHDLGDAVRPLRKQATAGRDKQRAAGEDK